MADCEIYKTIAAPCSGAYKEKGSKFLAFAFPVSDTEAVEKHLQELKKTYFDARHHCYAYRIGPLGALWRANDNGEPSSTAGKPILGQLVSLDLSDVLVVVVRYFGGIKLGVGGLINAYRSAAKDALQQATIVEKQVLELVELRFDFARTEAVMRAIRQTNATIVEQTFEQTPPPCRITARVLPSKAAALRAALTPNPLL